MDSFRFSGKKGMNFSAKLAARRDGSPLDGVLTLIGPNGKVVKVVDDTAKKLNVGEVLQQTDPELSAILPLDGTYRIALKALNGEGGKDYRYRLRMGTVDADFNVYTVRSMCNIAPRGSGRVKVIVSRTGGFKGDVRVFAGAFVPSQVIKGNREEYMMLVRNPAKRFTAPQNIIIYAEALINGRYVRKRVVPADIFNQAFAYDHLLPVQYFCVGTRRPWRRAPAKKPAVKKAAAPAKKPALKK